jgi:hypothetical protein
LTKTTDDKTRISFILLPGDSTSTGQHRRQISGFVNNHRPVPSITSSTPPRRSSTTEQQLISAIQRLSFSKPTINNDMNSPTKR